MPITPFMGVRISWLMLARNSLLARLAASAAFRAALRFAIRRSRAIPSVISSATVSSAVMHRGRRRTMRR